MKFVIIGKIFCTIQGVGNSKLFERVLESIKKYQRVSKEYGITNTQKSNESTESTKSTESITRIPRVSGDYWEYQAS